MLDHPPKAWSAPSRGQLLSTALGFIVGTEIDLPGTLPLMLTKTLHPACTNREIENTALEKMSPIHRLSSVAKKKKKNGRLPLAS